MHYNQIDGKWFGVAIVVYFIARFGLRLGRTTTIFFGRRLEPKQYRKTWFDSFVWFFKDFTAEEWRIAFSNRRKRESEKTGRETLFQSFRGKYYGPPTSSPLHPEESKVGL